MEVLLCAGLEKGCGWAESMVWAGPLSRSTTHWNHTEKQRQSGRTELIQYNNYSQD